MVFFPQKYCNLAVTINNKTLTFEFDLIFKKFQLRKISFILSISLTECESSKFFDDKDVCMQNGKKINEGLIKYKMRHNSIA